MSLFPENLDYTDKDFESVLARLQNVIQSVFPEWTDFNRGNFGNIILESFAFVADVVLFYQDAQSRESRIVTARLRRNLLALSKLIGFTPKLASAASTDALFTITKPDGVTAPDNDVELLKGQVVKTSKITDPIEFQLLDDFTHPASSTQSIITVEHSEFFVDGFQSNSLANQEFDLTRFPFLEVPTTPAGAVSAGNGGYTEVDDFLDSTATDLHFVVIVDERDQAILRFGNGTNGAIPVGSISAEYKIGGGAVGNVDSGNINRIDGTFTDTLGNPVTIAVTNTSDASGGSDRESNESIRERAPATLRVLSRAVAREDFEIVAETVSGVDRALMLTSNEDTSVEENSGDLFIIPSGGGVPSTTLKNAVLAQFTGTDPPFPHTLTFILNVLDPLYKTINVVATVYKQPEFTDAQVKANIQSALDDFFALRNDDGSKNTNVGFGFDFKDADGDPAGEIPFSDVHNAVRDTTGVRKVGDLITDFTLNGAHRDVVLELKEFPQLGTLRVINGDTGLEIP